MKKIILILLITLSSCTNDKDCSEERTNIFNKYQDLINKAINNKDQQDRLRDERDYKLASLKC